MWVFTQNGFISAVDNKVKPGLLAVRARDRQSLEEISEMAGSEIEFTPRRDYQYRTYVSRGRLEDFVKLSIETLDYSNFTDRLYVSRGKQFARAAGNVWTSMHAVADKEYEEWHTSEYSARNSR